MRLTTPSSLIAPSFRSPRAAPCEDADRAVDFIVPMPTQAQRTWSKSHKIARNRGQIVRNSLELDAQPAFSLLDLAACAETAAGGAASGPPRVARSRVQNPVASDLGLARLGAPAMSIAHGNGRMRVKRSLQIGTIDALDAGGYRRSIAS